jgi:hypothetical protein
MEIDTELASWSEAQPLWFAAGIDGLEGLDPFGPQPTVADRGGHDHVGKVF